LLILEYADELMSCLTKKDQLELLRMVDPFKCLVRYPQEHRRLIDVDEFEAWEKCSWKLWSAEQVMKGRFSVENTTETFSRLYRIVPHHLCSSSSIFPVMRIEHTSEVGTRMIPHNLVEITVWRYNGWCMESGLVLNVGSRESSHEFDEFMGSQQCEAWIDNIKRDRSWDSWITRLIRSFLVSKGKSSWRRSIEVVTDTEDSFNDHE
jgi:hypothetical protein